MEHHVGLMPAAQLRQVSDEVALQLLGIKRLQHGPFDGVVLPGAMMPQLFEPLRAWLPPGIEPQDKYELSECYQLTPESYRRVRRVDEPEKDGQLPRISYLDLSLFDVALEGAKRAPQGTPGFWDWYHLTNYFHRGRVVSDRMIRGAIRYFRSRGNTTEADAWQVVLARKQERAS